MMAQMTVQAHDVHRAETWNACVVEKSYAYAAAVVGAVKNEGHVGMGVKNDWSVLDMYVKGVLGKNCCAGSYPNDAEGLDRGLILHLWYRDPTMGWNTLKPQLVSSLFLLSQWHERIDRIDFAYIVRP